MARRDGIDPSYIDRRPLRLLRHHGILVTSRSGGSGLGLRFDDLDSVILPYTEDTFGNWWLLRRRCQRFLAACVSLKIMASAVLFETQPLDRTVLCRTVAKCALDR